MRQKTDHEEHEGHEAWEKEEENFVVELILTSLGLERDCGLARAELAMRQEAELRGAR